MTQFANEGIVHRMTPEELPWKLSCVDLGFYPVDNKKKDDKETLDA